MIVLEFPNLTISTEMIKFNSFILILRYLESMATFFLNSIIVENRAKCQKIYRFLKQKFSNNIF